MAFGVNPGVQHNSALSAEKLGGGSFLSCGFGALTWGFCR